MITLRRTTLLLMGMLLAIATSSVADEPFWSGWMGPQRDGWVADFTPPAFWPDELQKVWSVEIGTGYGTPLVHGDRIYVHARHGEMEVLHALGRATGETLWKQSETVPFQMGGGGERHGKGPKSSPVMADGRIFTMSITGHLTAWDAGSGDRLWQYAAPTEFGKTHPYWGHSTSPIVDDDRVIVHFGTDEGGRLTALNVETGDEVWGINGDGPSYSSPLVVEIDGVRQVIEWNHRALVGVDCQSGELLWEHPFPHEGTNQNMPTPTLFEGMVILGGENRGIHGFRPIRKNGQWTVETVWDQNEVALDMSSAVVNDGQLYGFSHFGAGRFFCLDPRTGNILWQGPGRTGQNAMLLSIPNHVVTLISNGELRVLRATPEQYQQVASYRVSNQPTWAPPVLFEGHALIKDQNRLTLWCLAD